VPRIGVGPAGPQRFGQSDQRITVRDQGVGPRSCLERFTGQAQCLRVLTARRECSRSRRAPGALGDEVVGSREGGSLLAEPE
jgi:hypothetical protein